MTLWLADQIKEITESEKEIAQDAAVESFEDLVKNLNCRYILLSYNNMSKKGNDRSNAKIIDDDILRILKAKGEEYRIKKVA